MPCFAPSTFVVTSTGMPAHNEMALNQCKPRQLRVKTGGAQESWPAK